jgi:hypothetical protein
VQVWIVLNVWKCAVILAGCSLLLPILGIIALIVELPESYRQIDTFMSFLASAGMYSLPPILNLLSLFWVNPKTPRFPRSKAFLCMSLLVACLAPVVLSPLVLLLLLGELSMRDYSSLWYGPAAFGLLVFLLQAIGIALLVLMFGISQFRSWLGQKPAGSAA